MRKLTDKQKDRQRQTLYSTLLAEAAGPKKKKKHLEISSFYTCIPQMMIIWSMVPKISGTTDKTFCIVGHFGPFTWSTTQKIKISKKLKKTLEIS